MPKSPTNKKKEPKFKKGQKVKVEEEGVGIIMDSYKANHGKGGWLYHIKQDEYLLGNIREEWITLIK